jgi:pimeloyl-ACP methyl ester carboxylesterase
MSSIVQVEKFRIPFEANFVSQGKGAPVVMIHGLAASLHDWDFILPELVQAGYSGYALDLLGHGDSPKPEVRGYQMDWIFDHFIFWFESLHLDQAAVLIGHSLGGYLALELARRFPDRTRALILVDPFYSLDQLPAFMRFTYRHPVLSGFVAHTTPEWLLRTIIDISSLSMGYSAGGLHALPEEVRAQTALDYTRTAPGVYNILNAELDLSSDLSSITKPSLVIWGERDQTLAPESFAKLVGMLPNARGRSISAGHVPHQSNADWFNGFVLEFLASLDASTNCTNKTSPLRSS